MGGRGVTVATVPMECAYGETMAEEFSMWPDAGVSLIDELAVSRGRFALIAGPHAETEVTVSRLRDDLGVKVVSVGRTFCDRQSAPSRSDIEEALMSATVLTEIEMLFSPALHLPVLAFLAQRSQERPTIAVWPGAVSQGRATYSAPGRSDFQDDAITNAVIVRPLPTRFPDEVPFEIERIFR